MKKSDKILALIDKYEHLQDLMYEKDVEKYLIYSRIVNDLKNIIIKPVVKP